MVPQLVITPAVLVHASLPVEHTQVNRAHKFPYPSSNNTKPTCTAYFLADFPTALGAKSWDQHHVKQQK